MMKKSYIYVIVAIFITTIGFCQQLVGAKGTGLNRADALQDALRNAVGMAVGVSLRSETKVENYMVISDAIASNTSGYIKNYTISKEIPFLKLFRLFENSFW